MSEKFSVLAIDRFGEIAAEDDDVLDYFLTTNAVEKIASGKAFLVLGRKGTGKTAIVRHFTEMGPNPTSKPLNLRQYPWQVHASRLDAGASEIQAYVSSWRYLIAVELATLLLKNNKAAAQLEAKAIKQFLNDNYGGVEPDLADILRPRRLKLGKTSFAPTILGNTLGSIEFERGISDFNFGHELNALSDKILECVCSIMKICGIKRLSLHFDELDQGLHVLDDQRARMIVGLILAARDVKRFGDQESLVINPVVYLRTDIWDDLQFSDKNKISETLALHLAWDSNALMKLVELRLGKQLSPKAKWADITDPTLMRGSQQKWKYILARTFLRPRDVIRFLNAILEEAKRRNKRPFVFINEDVGAAREAYSAYLKAELDDEIRPHWAKWDVALQTCSALRTITFSRKDFEREYAARARDAGLDSADALRTLYKFSVIGYAGRSGYGGSSWIFQYSDPQKGWDAAASRLKVHQGLKEYAKLSEERKT